MKKKLIKEDKIKKIFKDDMKSALDYFELKKNEIVIKIIKNKKLNSFLYIVVDDLESPRYFSLFKEDIKIGFLSTKEININSDDFLLISEVLINKEYRNNNLSKELYKSALDFCDCEGLASFIPNRLDTEKINKIYAEFNTVIFENYEYIYKKDNIS